MGWQRQSESLVARLKFRYENPSSYPDELLDLPVSLAIHYLHLATSQALVEGMRFWSNMHVGPGVDLSFFIHSYLSVGVHYMYPWPKLGQLVMKAYKDFAECLHWKVFFMSEKAKTNIIDDDYDPDYDLHRPRKKVAPAIDTYIERGIKLR